jgi:hypothetical protein
MRIHEFQEKRAQDVATFSGDEIAELRANIDASSAFPELARHANRTHSAARLGCFSEGVYRSLLNHIRAKTRELEEVA